MRTSLNALELLIGEESTHKLSEITSFNQRLVINNSTNNTGRRATFNAGLLVSLNETLSLNLTLQDRYDSFVSAPLKKNDILFFTGVNVKFGG